MSYIIKYKNGRITDSYRLLKMLEQKSRFRSDVQKSSSDIDTALTQAYLRFEENGLASRRHMRNPRTNRMAYLYSITEKGREALREADLRHQFPIGTKVYYDMYPFGRNIPAVVTNNGVEAIGEWKKYFEDRGMASYAPITDAQNITRRDNTTNAASNPPDDIAPSDILRSSSLDVIKVKVKKGNKESAWTDIEVR